MGEPNEDKSPTGLFEALAKQRRRCILRCLKNSNVPLALSDLATEVAAQENDVPITEVPTEDVEQVRTSLYHVHIPKLEDTDIVRYDQDIESVTLPETSEQLDQCMAYLETR